MSDADALRRAIAAQPDDDLPRLALADLLDESGDPARADFIRAQVALAQLPDHHPDRPALEDREHDLLAAHEADWLADFVDNQAPTSELFEWEWDRGFLNEIAATPLYLLDRGPNLFAAHPVRRWRVMGSGGAMPQDLIEAGRAPWITSLEAVDLAGWFQTIGELERFLTRSDLARLRELDLTDRWGLDDLPDILGRTPFRDQLTSLRCGPTGEADGCGVLDMRNFIRSLMGARLVELSTRGCGLTSADIRSLFTASCGGELSRLDLSDNAIDLDEYTPFLHASSRLRVLDLSGNGLGVRGLESLLGCGTLDQLRALDLNRSVWDDTVIHALVGSRFWEHAESLRMRDGAIPEGQSLAPLFALPGPPTLRLLDLWGHALSDRGALQLCAAPWVEALTWLGLGRTELTDAAARSIAASGRFSTLRTLHLSYNHPMWQPGLTDNVITDAGARALADAPSLANLRVLDLTATGITTAGVDAVLNGTYWRLSGLGVGACDLSSSAVGALASSPRLARLNWLDLSGNAQLGGLALAPLAESEYLCPLTELDIRGVDADDTVIAALRSRLGRRLSQ